MRASIRALLAIAAVAGTVVSARADIDEYESSALYPAQVTSMVFDGNTMAAGQSVTWGSWSVTFGAQPPIAKFTKSMASLISIGPLSCSNTAVGVHPCSIMIIWGGGGQAADGSSTACGIAPSENPSPL